MPESKKENSENFQNPIDPDKIAENAAFLPYATNVGSALVRPEDMGRAKGNAMMAMYEQTERQLSQLKEQMETLVRQAKQLQQRKEVSEEIYHATMNFRPVIGHIYHLYRRKSEQTPLLSLIAPHEWGKRAPFVFVATVKLLYDHTWEILELASEEKGSF